MPENLTYIAAVREAQRWALETYPHALVYGEDVGKPGGPYGSAKGLQSEFGASRVFDTPISESAILGSAIGAAIRGMRPIVEIMFADFFFVAMDQMVNQAANVRWASEGRMTAPLTVRTQQGAAPGSCAQHSRNVEAFFAHVPGIRTCVPATPQDAYDLLRAAVQSDDPTVVIENRTLYAKRGPVELGGPIPDIGRAAVVRPGSDLTIVSWSAMLHRALEAASQLSERGVEAEVIDLRWASPIDYDTLLSSVARTGRLLIAHEAPLTGGLGAEIAATVSENLYAELQAPVRRLGSLDVPMPAAPELSAAVVPSVDALVQAALGLQA